MRSSLRFLRPLVVCGSLAAVLLVAGASSAAGVTPSAATTEQKAQAMQHFTSGKQAIEQKNYEKAATELRASLDVVNSPNARLELARALRDAGKDGEAWAEYGRVVDDATKLAATEERYAKTAEAAGNERGAIETKLAFVSVTVAHAPDDATLKAGGRSVPRAEWSAPIVVPPGAVDVVLADAAGKELARQTVSASLGQKAPVTLDAQPAPPKADVPVAQEKPDATQPAEAPPSSSSDRSKLRMYSYVVGGVGVAGMALFTVFGLMDNSTYDDLKSACTGNVCPPNKQGEVSAGKTQQTVANVGLILGGVGLAAGATLFVISLSSKSPASSATGLVVAPGFLGLRGSL
ncbi:MAG TPA: tetratricopeptide repeat protein [Polyangiaceae bacterium]|jgi:hypothetical protein